MEEDGERVVLDAAMPINVSTLRLGAKIYGAELGASHSGAELGASPPGRSLPRAQELGASDGGAELGASINDVELRVNFLNSFRQGSICEKLSKKSQIVKNSASPALFLFLFLHL